MRAVQLDHDRFAQAFRLPEGSRDKAGNLPVLIKRVLVCYGKGAVGFGSAFIFEPEAYNSET